jgi:hypothetical protein
MQQRLPVAGLVIALLACGTAAAADPAFELGLGITRLDVREPLLDSTTSGGVQLGLSFSPWRERPQMRLGVLVSVSSYDEDVRFPLPPQPELFAPMGRFSELHLVTPEVRLSWRQPIDQFFIEPGIGLGLVVGRYEAGEMRLGAFGRFDEVLVRRTRSGIGVRPLVRAGYHFDRWDLGIEASYLMTSLRFGDGVGGRTRELYVGGFMRWYLD